MSDPTPRRVPPLRDLGPDLLRLTRRQRATTLALPFACAGLYFAGALAGQWGPAVLAVMALSFVTYGSTSHDLVHRNLGLPTWANQILLCATELLCLRSGHAYRAAHLNHHARFPAEDDIEAAAARMTWVGALIDGLTLQPRVWWWAVRRGGPERGWMIGEGIGCLALFGTALALAPVTVVPLVYVALVTAGSWVFPLVTAYVPHDAAGADELSRTRIFRGPLASVIGLGHLYHLEHHLYPAVPHHHWPELARRLDPHLARAGVRPVRIGF